jgi:hypothetical protein
MSYPYGSAASQRLQIALVSVLRLRASVSSPPDRLTHAPHQVGPTIIGNCVNVLLWSLLATCGLQFVLSAQWQRFSLKLRAAFSVVLLFCTLDTGTAFFSIWHYGTTQKVNFYGKTAAQQWQVPLLGVISVCVQSIMVIRASMVRTG